MIIACVETKAQFDRATSWAQERQARIEILAITPEAEYLSRQSGLTAHDLEKFCDHIALQEEAHLNSQLVDRFCDIVNAALRDTAPDFPEARLFSAKAFFHTLRIFFDIFTLRVPPLVSALKTLRPTLISCFPEDDATDSFGDPSFFPVTGFSTSCLPIITRQIPIPLECVRGTTVPKTSAPAMRTPCPERLPSLIRQYRELLSSQSVNILPATKPLLISTMGTDNSQADIIRKCIDRGLVEYQDIQIFQEGTLPTFLAGTLVHRLWLSMSRIWHKLHLPLPNSFLHPEHPFVRLLADEIGNHLWNKLENSSALSSLFRWSEIDCFPLAKPFLQWFLKHQIPRTLVRAPFIAKTIQALPRAIILQGGMEGEMDIVGRAAHERGFPTISMHRGGYLGYCRLPFHERYDMGNCDYFLVNGLGSAKHFAQPSTESAWPSDVRRATPVALGAPWIEEIVRKHAAYPSPRRTQKTIMYVMTGMVGDKTYFDYVFYPPFEYSRFQFELAEFARNHPSVRFLFKPHLSHRYTSLVSPVIDWLKRNPASNISLLPEKPLTELLDEADAFIIDYPSTPLMETVATGKPIVAYIDHRYFRFLPDAAEKAKKRMIFTETKEDFFRQLGDFLLSDWETPSASNDEFLVHYGLQNNDGNVVNRIADFIGKLAGETGKTPTEPSR